MAKSEKLNFQTEVKQLLNLMIHSLYSNKEIAIRELISNASDATDKLRFEALDNDKLYEGDSDLKVVVDFDSKANTLTITDNGIGMDRDDLVNNLGTIARSGTKEFLANMSGDNKKDANLIGQFGVGFYSSFIIAKEVTVQTRKAGNSQAYSWSSQADGEFTIKEIEKESRGTSVVLKLKDDEKEFTDAWRLQSIIRKYSDHISIPIQMYKADMKKDELVKLEELETINNTNAIWTRAKSEIKQKEYEEFYKSLSYDSEEPLAYYHNRVEGKTEYTSLLYLPKKAPFDLYDRENNNSIKLYVRKVFVMDANEKLIPQYLRFVKGVIDSQDLSLNVSREILQDSPLVDSIKSGVTKRVLSSLQTMSEKEPEKYQSFWNEFGKVLKEGPAEDFANKESIAKLLRFASSNTDEQLVSFESYIKNMPKEQESIYYITADSHQAAKNSPHLEIFKQKNIEVLLLSDRVDEWLVSSLNEFDGKKLQSIAKGDLDLGKLDTEEQKAEKEKIEKESKNIVEKIKKSLGDKVKEVKVTHRLTNSPACLVVGEHDISGNLERILKAAGQSTPENKPILEVNPNHELIKKLENIEENQLFNDYSSVILDQAILAEGGQLDDPIGYVNKVNKFLI
ncbi:heat shock protein 90 [Methylophilales bacterium MBRSG12]|uniref:Chaperone protein HtpG n=1 Tax=Methylophilales bacterium MBRS-H7 TaxID=1623450 RepID=A0A0H4J0V8_9PROT|nr:heat shock protein 90 [Methylophilales bacterium MBRSF5]AKO65403.1 heat shock protein 90 [Methylophilales bacterium MBRS-H7]AKO66722.1 heat shock protein 90 [Methylophilales bacterium MBRSG12]